MKKIREGYYHHKGYDITESKPMWKIEQIDSRVFNSPSAAKKFIDNRDESVSRRLHKAIKEKVHSRFGITEAKNDSRTKHKHRQMETKTPEGCYRSIFGEKR